MDFTTFISIVQTLSDQDLAKLQDKYKELTNGVLWSTFETHGKTMQQIAATVTANCDVVDDNGAAKLIRFWLKRFIADNDGEALCLYYAVNLTEVKQTKTPGFCSVSFDEILSAIIKKPHHATSITAVKVMAKILTPENYGQLYESPLMEYVRNLEGGYPTTNETVNQLYNNIVSDEEGSNTFKKGTFAFLNRLSPKKAFKAGLIRLSKCNDTEFMQFMLKYMKKDSQSWYQLLNIEKCNHSLVYLVTSHLVNLYKNKLGSNPEMFLSSLTTLQTQISICKSELDIDQNLIPLGKQLSGKVVLKQIISKQVKMLEI